MQPRYVVNQVTAGDYDCPRKVLKFLTELHAAFRMLNLRNDFLRKKFDGSLSITILVHISLVSLFPIDFTALVLTSSHVAGMKYDLRRVEEVYYDVKIRGLTANGDSTGDQKSSLGQPQTTWIVYFCLSVHLHYLHKLKPVNFFLNKKTECVGYVIPRTPFFFFFLKSVNERKQ